MNFEEFMIGDRVEIDSWFEKKYGTVICYSPNGNIGVLMDGWGESTNYGHSCDGVIKDFPKRKGWFYTPSKLKKVKNNEEERRAELLLKGELYV